jgi:sugar (pentulose or hexulose) kinase
MPLLVGPDVGTTSSKAGLACHAHRSDGAGRGGARCDDRGDWRHAAPVAVGGWLRSDALLAVKQQALGPLLRPAVDEPGARAAAFAAGRSRTSPACQLPASCRPRVPGGGRPGVGQAERP